MMFAPFLATLGPCQTVWRLPVHDLPGMAALITEDQRTGKHLVLLSIAQIALMFVGVLMIDAPGKPLLPRMRSERQPRLSNREDFSLWSWLVRAMDYWI